MDTSVYIVTSRLLGQRTKMNMVADNVANLNTPGYKRLDIDFKEVLSKQMGEVAGSFTQHRGTRFDFSAGALEKTGNTFDMAIQGEGFFSIDVNGQQQYTRDGHFLLDSVGKLVTHKGYSVLDSNGAPITIPRDSTSINITSDGIITDQNGAISTIGIFKFSSPQNLTRAGAAYIASEEATPIELPRIMQGMIETSNVNSVNETIKMTEIVRAYQSGVKLVKQIEDLESKAISQLSRMGQ